MVVIILGAGASVESGIPTFSTFLSEAERLADTDERRFAVAVWKKFYSNFNLEEVVTALRAHESLRVGLYILKEIKPLAKKAGIEDTNVPLARVAQILEDLVPRVICGTAKLNQVA